MQILKFDIRGMTCSGCTGTVQRALSKLEGVSRVDVSLRPGIAIVQADPAHVTSGQIESMIAELGYFAKVHSPEPNETVAS